MCIGKLFGKVFENVTIESAGTEGMSLARIDGQVCFVKYGVPGDVADIKLYAKKKKVLFAEIQTLIKPGKDRVTPFCSHFGTCGGCKWQQMDYQAQLSWKNQHVIDAFERIGKVQCETWEPIVGGENDRYYRNKLEYAFSNQRWLTFDEMKAGAVADNAAGFHIAGRFDKILNIEQCFLQDDRGNQIRNFVRDYAIQNHIDFYDVKAQTGFLRNLMIRNTSTEQWMLVLIVGRDEPEILNPLLEQMLVKFPFITSLVYGVNGKVNDAIYDIELHTYFGPDYIEEDLDGLRFRIRPKSFFQTNTKQALKLYNLVAEYAGLTGKENVYDLYCGTGSITLFLARYAQKVTGIESVPQAIEDAHENATQNGISNVSFLVGDMRFLFNDQFIENSGFPDVIITDPPRAGMHGDVVEQLLKIASPKIVYVSCNPATQARDLALLESKYRIVKTRPVDMFPHTHHIENVTLLELR